MQFNDLVDRNREVYVQGAPFSDRVRSEDRKLGEIVLMLFSSFGLDARGLKSENLEEHFEIDDSNPKQVRITVKPSSTQFSITRSQS